MKVKTLAEATNQLIDDIDARVLAGGVEIIGIPTGFFRLDAALGGFRNKGHYILGGKTGMGKSAMALTIAEEIASKGKSVLYASFEMDATLLSLRLLSAETKIPAMAIERGQLTKDQFEAVKKAREKINTLNMYIVDTACATPQLSALAVKMKDADKLDFMV